MKSVKIGFLPLYLKLYDDTCGFMRERIDSFCTTIIKKLESLGLEVVPAPICRVKSEFDNAMRLFDDVCALVTLHLAYSPSLECIEALESFQKPIVVMDTTPTYEFSSMTGDEEILYNHGIHGVQDMCSMLKRRGKAFYIEAGHWENSDVLDRVHALCLSAAAADKMKRSRVGIIGEPFEGMGDFFVTPEGLKSTVGADVVMFDMKQVGERSAAITKDDIQKEMDEDLILFDSLVYNAQAHERTARAGLIVRRWIEENALCAYTLNFANIDRNTGFECVPFVEASKAMYRGIGFAGEGDVLTATLCGALLSVYPETSFTEMFCPDWKNDTIFLSHMGEMNPRCAKGKMKLSKMDYQYTDAASPVVAYGCFKPGKAVLVNLAPIEDNRYTLILSPVSMLDFEGEDRMADSVHGWFKPRVPVDRFLESFSKAGGTHHLVLVYTENIKALEAFGHMMNFHVEVI